MRGVLGIDLAARHTGFCYIPPDWDERYDSLKCDEISYGLKGKLDERTKLQVMLNAAKVGLGVVSDCGPEIIVVEDYAYNKHSSSSTMQAEIGGVVKSQIYLSTNIVPTMIVASKARRFMTGGLRGKRKTDAPNGIKCLPQKKQVQQFLVNRGFAFRTEDIADAFVVAYFRYCEANGVKCQFEPIEEHEQVEYGIWPKKKATKRRS